MTVFVTGVNGQLGHDVMKELHRRGYTGIGSDRTSSCDGIADGSAVVEMPYVQLDITDRDMVESVITEIHPDALIHCAVWTDVDQAEEEAELVRAINVEGTSTLQNVCIVEDVKIGNNVTTGVGSVVTKDIPDNATAVGNYAKVINYNYPEDL